MRNQILPPSCVYFTALESRLIKIWLIRVSSPRRYSWCTPITSTWNFWFFACAIGRMIASTEDTRSFSVNSSTESTTFPLSILETSKMSLIKLSRCWPDAVIFFVYARTFSGFSASFASSVVKPSTAFIGVRISCDILERNIVLELFASCAACSASASWRLWISRSASRSLRILFCSFCLKKYSIQQRKNAPSITTTTIKIFWLTVRLSCWMASSGT